MKEKIDGLITEFNSETHGRSDYDKDEVFIMSEDEKVFLPLKYIVKKLPEDVRNLQSLLNYGYVYSSLTYMENESFSDWYNNQFGKKLLIKAEKNIGVLHFPEHKKIFDTIEVVYKSYKLLKESHIIMNGKNLPVQLGEWYAKTIFGLKQIKSSSQRGFDFIDHNGKHVEVKVHWHDATSPKGVKVKKSLAELSDHVIIMYVAKNFMIRDIIFLDSDFVLRKYGSKGHTIFLKDSDIGNYFFSKSNKHYSKIVNKMALMKFASPNFAIKVDAKLEELK